MMNWSYDSLRRKTEEEVTTVGSGVDSTVRAFTWTYDSEGHPVYITSHSDTIPDTSTWTDALNQIKLTYNAADQLTKEEQEHDAAVDGSTLAVEYGYGTDYSTGNYNRKNWIEYPNDRKIWYGYTRSSPSTTLQDTINDKFSRIGQIARDNSGSIGDILAEYDFNGMNRMVRRTHDEDTGMYGNDTMMDLWHGTSGDYDGLDRFGRIVDMKLLIIGGSSFARREYRYDRDSNRKAIIDDLHTADSQELTYDNLNRLTNEDRGMLDGSDLAVLTKLKEETNMDLLGNFTDGAGGIKINSDSKSVTLDVNETNEITTISRPNTSGAAKVIDDAFTSSLSSTVWSQDIGTWSISSGQVNVDALGISYAKLLSNADLDFGSMEVKVTFPTNSSLSKAGIIFSDDGSNNFYAVVLDRRNARIALHSVSSGTFGAVLASGTATFSDSTQYTLKVFRTQRHVYAEKVGESGANFSYDSTADLGEGAVGLYSNKTDVKFDDFYFAHGYGLVPALPRWRSSAKITGDTTNNNILVESSDRGGETVLEGFTDDDYMLQYEADLNSGADAVALVRYVDPNNHYRVELTSSSVALVSVDRGMYSTIASASHSSSSWIAMKVKLSGTTIKVWVAGTLKINTTDSTIEAGGVGFAGEKPKFKSIKVGYDTNADDDIDDAGDDIVYDDDFTTTSVTATYDNNGNLTDDGTFKYSYDAWNRLVAVKTQHDELTLASYEFDAQGRRIKKVVTNSQPHDGTVVYLYDGWKICETRDGSNNMVQQFIHGTQYIDELVMMRAKDKGDLYVHQDANWNVIALTDLGGSVVERNVLTPYGELTFQQETSYGDRDGDGDVDSTDKGTPGSTCTGTVSGACRILDLDFDGDYDSSDATLFDALDQGLARHPGRTSSGVNQLFGHQGLLFEAEIESYQNRWRQYDPAKRRFLQRDPLSDGTVGIGPDEISSNQYIYKWGATKTPNNMWNAAGSLVYDGLLTTGPPTSPSQTACNINNSADCGFPPCMSSNCGKTWWSCDRKVANNKHYCKDRFCKNYDDNGLCKQKVMYVQPIWLLGICKPIPASDPNKTGTYCDWKPW